MSPQRKILIAELLIKLEVENIVIPTRDCFNGRYWLNYKIVAEDIS